MKLNRRVFLNSVFIGAPVALGSHALPAFGSDPDPFMLLVDGISPATSAEKLFSFLDPIISQGIPLGCVLRLNETDQPVENPELFKLLGRLRADYPGLIEIILAVPGLAEQNGYFRMRRAAETQTLFRKMQADSSGPSGRITNSLTLATEQPAGTPPIFDGIRSAGFQNVILLPTDNSPVDIWRTNDGTQMVFGGRRLAAGDEKNLTAGEIVLGRPVVVVATYPDANEINEEEIFNRGAELGDAVAKLTHPGDFFMTLPSDLQLMSGEIFTRNLVLCVEDNGTSAGLKPFLEKLSGAGLAFSQFRMAGDDHVGNPTVESVDPGKSVSHACWMAENGAVASLDAAKSRAFATQSNSEPEVATCVGIFGNSVDQNPDASAGLDLLVDLSSNEPEFVGLNRFGALQIPISVEIESSSGQRPADVLRAKLGGGIVAPRDSLVFIRAGAFEKATDADDIVAVLSELQKSAEINIVDLRQHHEILLVKDEPARLLKAAHRIPVTPVDNPAPASEMAILLEDAKHAWSYFKLLTDPVSGLVPATAWTEGDQIVSYQFATMWDTGSHVLALVSAHAIGLIDGGEFHDRAVKLLGSLAVDKFADLTLPRGLTSTNGKGEADNGYNASDTSRLLTALKVLQGYATKELGISEIIARWDIDKTFKEGVPQTVRNGRFIRAYESNYAGYLARGFALWGYNPAPPYTAPRFGTGMDADVSILHEVATFGPVAAEPHLLEAIELGFSEVARAASEALFAAQFEAFQATGKLKCVSEAPIDREPWFVYHGYQIGASNQEQWTAETLDNSARFKTKGFLRSIEMLNSKAAYLWHVVRPGEYSSLLVEEARAKAKKAEFGFSPGVFLTSGRAVQNYSDVNTNCVVLQAIAYRLNAQRPALAWRESDRGDG